MPVPQLMRCNAVLHPNDLPEGYKLLRDGQPLPLENDPHVIRRGIHAQVRCVALCGIFWVSDVWELEVCEFYVRVLIEDKPRPFSSSRMQVYVKDVFPNSGRFSVTLDPTIDKSKVVKGRMQKRAQGKKRNKIEPVQVALGDEMEGQVVKVLRRGLLLDAGLQVPVFLALSSIADEGTLQAACRQGRRMAVRVSEKTEKQIKCELLKLL